MKIICRLLLASCLCGTASAEPARRIYYLDGKNLSFKKDNLSRICTLDDPPRFAVESFDRSAVIVSERGFVSSHALDSCTSERSVHVSLIPEGVGVLADVNLNKRLYISLDFVNVQPFLYLAMVASLDSRINMVTLHGATVPGRSLSLQKKYAFGGLASAGSAAISPDGRFVAPTGEPICTDDAYPGVWDIANNRRVITDDVSCAQLLKSK